jgi:tripartite-type tricarboxylate transporter receptor subunit TctC
LPLAGIVFSRGFDMTDIRVSRRRWVQAGTGVALLNNLPAIAQPGRYPLQPVKIIVPFAPGGGTDVVARLIAQRLGDRLGHTVIVENRPGAGGSIGTEQIARAPADGYTIGLVPSSHVINKSLYPRLNYDTDKDFAPLMLVGSATILLAANPQKVQSREFKAFIAEIKKSGSTITTYGSAGNGTVFHLLTESLSRAIQIPLTHVPYRGGGPAVTGLLGGEVAFVFETLLALQPHVKSGKLVPLAVMSRQRSPQMPEVPTIVEIGLPQLVATNDYALLAPAATPQPVLDVLVKGLATIMQQPDVKGRLFAQGVETVASSPAQLTSHFSAESKRWAQVIRDASIKLE